MLRLLHAAIGIFMASSGHEYRMFFEEKQLTVSEMMQIIDFNLLTSMRRTDDCVNLVDVDTIACLVKEAGVALSRISAMSS